MKNTVAKLERMNLSYKGTNFTPRVYEKTLTRGITLITIQLVNEAHEGNKHEPFDLRKSANENVLGFAEVLVGTYQDFVNCREEHLAKPRETRLELGYVDPITQVSELMWALNRQDANYAPEDKIAFIPMLFIEQVAQNRGIGKALMGEVLKLADCDVYCKNMPFKRVAQTGVVNIGTISRAGTEYIDGRYEPKDSLNSFLSHFNAVKIFPLPQQHILVIRKQN